MKQFKYLEFVNKLHKVLEDKETRYHCKYKTRVKLENILGIDYPYKEDDIEYLMDMVNYHMRNTGYDSKKKYYKLGQVLDSIMAESVFYIDEIVMDVAENTSA